MLNKSLKFDLGASALETRNSLNVNEAKTFLFCFTISFFYD